MAYSQTEAPILLDIDRLRQDNIPGIDDVWGALLAKACVMALKSQHHESGVFLSIEGVLQNVASIQWEDFTIGTQTIRAWGEPREMTEYAACGLAIVIILACTSFTVIERSYQTTGFDYWLGHKDSQLFEYHGRLEVAGLRSASISEISATMKRKSKQTRTSDHLEIPAYIAVVEFSRPYANTEYRQ